MAREKVRTVHCMKWQMKWDFVRRKSRGSKDEKRNIIVFDVEMWRKFDHMLVDNIDGSDDCRKRHEKDGEAVIWRMRQWDSVYACETQRYRDDSDSCRRRKLRYSDQRDVIWRCCESELWTSVNNRNPQRAPCVLWGEDFGSSSDAVAEQFIGTGTADEKVRKLLDGDRIFWRADPDEKVGGQEGGEFSSPGFFEKQLVLV